MRLSRLRCSSLVPIVETERQNSTGQAPAQPQVAVHSFRLWKLKVRQEGDIPCNRFGCSSLVPIVETESRKQKSPLGYWCCCSSLVPIVETESDPCPMQCLPSIRVAVYSFRLWKLKVGKFASTAQPTRWLQFTRSDCGN